MGPSIVLADDQDDLRAVYAEALRRDGYMVREAADGRAALSAVAEEPPTLLILDVWMPGLNGFEVLDQLRHDPAVSGMKIVMLSNLGDADTLLEGYSGGVVDYWVKGLALEDLCERVRRIVAGTAIAPEPY
jgi:DNA-binding response OmpR family regulator